MLPSLTVDDEAWVLNCAPSGSSHKLTSRDGRAALP